MDNKVIRVADLDPLMQMYKVVDESGTMIGEKTFEGKYRRAQWQKNGRKLPYDKLDYRATPHWMNREVTRICHGSPHNSPFLASMLIFIKDKEN